MGRDGMMEAGVNGAVSAFVIRPGEPGFRRNQLIDPRPGMVVAAIEDDMHHFRVTLVHDGETVSEVRTEAIRWPWTTCPAAGDHLARRMTGARLAELGQIDPPQSHCTHQYEIALLAAAHALDAGPVLYSAFAADRHGRSQHGELFRNGVKVLDWMMEGSRIVSEGPWQDRDLRQFKEWSGLLAPDEVEAVKVLRRVIHTSSARLWDGRGYPTADMVTGSAGACYTFDPARAAGAAHVDMRHDFTGGGVPLGALIEEAARKG